MALIDHLRKDDWKRPDTRPAHRQRAPQEQADTPRPTLDFGVPESFSIVAASPYAHVTPEQETILTFMRDSITHETLEQ